MTPVLRISPISGRLSAGAGRRVSWSFACERYLISHGASFSRYDQRKKCGQFGSSNSFGPFVINPAAVTGDTEHAAKTPALPEDVPSPGGFLSTSVTGFPLRRSQIAAETPTTPAPMTTMCFSCDILFYCRGANRIHMLILSCIQHGTQFCLQCA